VRKGVRAEAFEGLPVGMLKIKENKGQRAV
jgi:hypothetical protein